MRREPGLHFRTKMDAPSAPDTPPRLSRGQRQFTIRSILFVMLMVAIAAAGFGGLVRAADGDLSTTFVMFVVAAPLGLLLVVSISTTVQRWLEARRRQNGTSDEDPPAARHS